MGVNQVGKIIKDVLAYKQSSKIHDRKQALYFFPFWFYNIINLQQISLWTDWSRSKWWYVMRTESTSSVRPLCFVVGHCELTQQFVSFPFPFSHRSWNWLWLPLDAISCYVVHHCHLKSRRPKPVRFQQGFYANLSWSTLAHMNTMIGTEAELFLFISVSNKDHIFSILEIELKANSSTYFSFQQQSFIPDIGN